MSFAIRSRRARALALAALGVIPTLAHATTTSWTFNGNGNWTTSSNWSGGVPVNGSDVFIGHNTITYDYAAASIQFNSTTIDNTSTGSFATSVMFSQSANTFNSVVETIGNAGHGLWTLSGGTHNVTASGFFSGLGFGGQAGSRGIGTITGGTLNVGGGQIFLGYDGAGTFTQSGGSVTAQFMTMGYNPDGTGTYNLSAGSATFTGALFVGDGGNGTLNLSGGMLNGASEYIGSLVGSGWVNQTAGVNIVSSGSLVIGDQGTGTYLLSGTGSLTVNGTEVVGVEIGTATFNQTGGTHTVGSLDVGSYTGSVGNYFLSAAGSLTVNGTEIVGDRGAGTFNQSGGAQTTGGLALGAFFTGTYLLSSTGALTVNGEEDVGVSGAGTFDQSGGTHQVGAVLQPGTLAIGAGSTGAGTFLLGGTSSLIVNGLEVVGQLGAGTFNQSGGTNSVVGELDIGEPDISGGGTGTYSLSGGTLIATTLNVNAHGTLNFSGGTLSATTLNLNAGGTLLFSGGTLSGGTGNIMGGYFSVPAGGNAHSSGTLNFQSQVNAGDPTAQIRIDGTLTHTGTLITDNTFLGGAGTLALTSTSTFRGSGELNVSVVNNSGTIVADAGNLFLTGNTLNNTGTLKNLPGGSLFVKPALLANLGNVIVNAGGVVSFDPPLTNPSSHTIGLLGGVLAAPSVTNSVGGAISGFGQITGGFINSGSVSFIGPTQIVGNFTNNAGGVVAVRNAQTLVVGTAINNGSITTSNGTMIFDSGIAPAPPLDGPGGLDGAGTLIVNPGGHLISSYVRQSALVVGGTVANSGIAIIRDRADGGDVSVLDSLGMSGTTRAWQDALDLADNDLIVHTTPIASIADYISTGFNGGDWQGLGISSSTAASVAGEGANAHKTALGYATASSIGVSVFDGQSVGGSQDLVRYTWSGDANLDSVVNALDFNALATNFGSVSGKLWTQGDFNYDGVTNTADFTALARNFNQVLQAPALGSLVPEPASTITTTLLMLLSIRKRKMKATIDMA